MRSVYYLIHADSHQRLRYYHTLAGARIAQRARNHRLGFHHRLERVWVGDREWEQCVDHQGQVVTATWIIEEGVIEQEDLCLQ